MKICSVPLDIVYASVEDNIVSAAKALNDVESDTDIVVLPELFTTSFVPDIKSVERIAESNDGRTVGALRRWAEFFGFAIAGSFLATDGGSVIATEAFLWSHRVKSPSMTSVTCFRYRPKIRYIHLDANCRHGYATEAGSSCLCSVSTYVSPYGHATVPIGCMIYSLSRQTGPIRAPTSSRRCLPHVP